MTLCDTGPIVALLNRRDPKHAACAAVLGKLTPPLITTQACVTEAMYLLRRSTGYQGQAELWRMIETQKLVIAETGMAAMRQAQAFMSQYQDSPCDYADATLLALAEELPVNLIFTLDRHFHAYILSNGNVLKTVPAGS